MSLHIHKKVNRHPLLGERQTQNLVSLLLDLGRSMGVEVPDPSVSLDFLDIDYSESDISRFRDRYLCSEFLSKYPFEVKGVDRVAVALNKFRECEAHCSLVNTTIRTSTESPSGLSWHAVLRTASKKVDRLLGPFSWDLVEDRCGFGPGASTSHKRGSSDAFYKFRDKPDVTPDCALLAWHLVRRQPAWWEQLTLHRPSANWVDDYWRFPPEVLFRQVAGNRVTTVPKNAKTDRIIAIEPDMNMYVQKGLGAVLRSRLRRAGIDLNDQTLNQRLALAGSLNGDLATVDFSSASDTVSLAVCEELLPADWLCALKQARSPVGVLPDGSIIQYSKISSMGNGFTFELESLIFWAISKAVVELTGVGGIISVYGDDLICPTAAETDLLWAFSRAGFTPNEKKSHFRGGFRESCGKHYFHGCDVTPFYVRKRLSTLWDLYSLANNVHRWARLSYGLDPRVKALYDAVVGGIPESLRFKIPEGFGDVGLVSDFDDATPSFDKGLQILRCKSISPKVRPRTVDGLSLISKWFHLAGSGHGGSDAAVERILATDPKFGKVVRLHVREWDNFGPFLTG